MVSCIRQLPAMPNLAPVEAQWATSTTDGIARKVAAWQRNFGVAWCKCELLTEGRFVFDTLVGSWILKVSGRITLWSTGHNLKSYLLEKLVSQTWACGMAIATDDSRHVLIGILAEHIFFWFSLLVVSAFSNRQSRLSSWAAWFYQLWNLEFLAWSSGFSILCKVNSANSIRLLRE